MKNNQPEISICIPTYNRAYNIISILKDAINQENTDKEILICDNASEDETIPIVQEFIKNNPEKSGRIHLHINTENIGFANNCNKLAKLAKGKYIVFFHSDDTYDSSFCEESINLIKKNKLDAVFCRMGRLYLNGRREKVMYPVELHEDKPYLGEAHDYTKLLLKYGNFFPCPAFLCERTKYIALGGMSEKYFGNEDIDLWCRLLEKNMLIGFNHKVLMHHGISENQYSETMRRYKTISPMFEVLDSYLLDKVNDKETIQEYRRMKAIGYLNAAYNCYRKGDTKQANKNITMSKETYRFGVNESIKKYIYQNLTLLYYKLSRVKNG